MSSASTWEETYFSLDLEKVLFSKGQEWLLKSFSEGPEIATHFLLQTCYGCSVFEKAKSKLARVAEAMRAHPALLPF